MIAQERLWIRRRFPELTRIDQRHSQREHDLKTVEDQLQRLRRIVDESGRVRA